MNEQSAESTCAASAWDHFLESSRPDIGFKQSSWWTEFLSEQGWESFGAVSKDADVICGGANVLIRSFARDRCYYYIAHGPVLPGKQEDAEEVFAALLEHIAEVRRADPRVVSHLRLEANWVERPSFIEGCKEVSGWVDPRLTLRVDLSEPATAILEQMKPKGRYNIRVAQRKGVSIVEDVSPQGVADFLGIYNKTLRRHRVHRHTSDYFRSLAERLAVQNRGTILFAEYQGERIATALFIYFGDTATYNYGGSLTVHRNVMAPYLLHFEAMLRAKARGHRWYDFYGVAPVDQPDDPWADFSAFKRKFGGQERKLVPALDFIYDQDAYQEYRRRRRA
jgi:lipid II:glycine glycyltransferase (peptidoglycan interpeptide bridge formation enzyme)